MPAFRYQHTYKIILTELGCIPGMTAALCAAHSSTVHLCILIGKSIPPSSTPQSSQSHPNLYLATRKAGSSWASNMLVLYLTRSQ